MYKLFVTPQYEKDFKKLPPTLQEKIDKLVQLLKKNPLNPLLKPRKLKGFKISLYRVKIGPYRLVYSFNKTSIILHRVAHRKDIYRKI